MPKCAIFVLVFCAAAHGQASPKRSVEVALERAQEGNWKDVSPRTVFSANEEIRFRFRASFPGYLYVLNQTSSGERLWLFPTKSTGLENRVEADRDYRIPATEGSFKIPPRAGFDTILWIVSGEILKDITDLPDPVAPNREALLPRCREQLLRARGRCEDDRAGIKPLANTDLLPRGVAGSAFRPQDLAIKENAGSSQITMPSSAEFFAYQITIAHR